MGTNITRIRAGDGITVTCNAEGCDWERASASDLSLFTFGDHARETGHKGATVKDDYEHTSSFFAEV